MAHSAYSQRKLKPFLEPRGPLYPCQLKSPSLRYQNRTSILQMSMLIAL